MGDPLRNILAMIQGGGGRPEEDPIGPIIRNLVRPSPGNMAMMRARDPLRRRSEAPDFAAEHMKTFPEMKAPFRAVDGVLVDANGEAYDWDSLGFPSAEAAAQAFNRAAGMDAFGGG